MIIHVRRNHLKFLPCHNIIISVVAKLLIRNLDLNRASGSDGILAHILQLVEDKLAPAFSVIFQKNHTIVGLFLIQGCKPKSLLFDIKLLLRFFHLHLLQILEHIIHSNMNHFDHFLVLTDKQHDFRSKHSTESQLILTTHNLAFSLNNKSQVDMIIMDFSKVFDVVPHNQLLNINTIDMVFKIRHMLGSPAFSSTVSESHHWS